MNKKYFSLYITCMIFVTAADAQNPLTSPPNGGNKKASVSERIGITDITVNYNRPHVNGREGKIWGGVVHYGFKFLNFGPNRLSPWRAGANENTTISFSHDVKINGNPLAAGIYGFFIAVYPGQCTLIFSKNSGSWGSYYYDSTEDALRVNVRQEYLDQSNEWLEYRFLDETDSSATLALIWEKWKIPFTVSVDLVKTQIDVFREELRGEKQFIWESWDQAATFCADHNTNLNEAITWIDRGIMIDSNFSDLMTKSQLLDSIGKKDEAATVHSLALNHGKIIELYLYGRQLITDNHPDEAMSAFKIMAEKYPGNFYTDVGLTRIYSAKGDFNNAIINAKNAATHAPNEQNKKAVLQFIEQLKAHKDINKH